MPHPLCRRGSQYFLFQTFWRPHPLHLPGSQSSLEGAEHLLGLGGHYREVYLGNLGSPCP